MTRSDTRRQLVPAAAASFAKRQYRTVTLQSLVRQSQALRSRHVNALVAQAEDSRCNGKLIRITPKHL